MSKQCPLCNQTYSSETNECPICRCLLIDTATGKVPEKEKKSIFHKPAASKKTARTTESQPVEQTKSDTSEYDDTLYDTAMYGTEMYDSEIYDTETEDETPDSEKKSWHIPKPEIEIPEIKLPELHLKEKLVKATDTLKSHPQAIKGIAASAIGIIALVFLIRIAFGGSDKDNAYAGTYTPSTYASQTESSEWETIPESTNITPNDIDINVVSQPDAEYTFEGTITSYGYDLVLETPQQWNIYGTDMLDGMNKRIDNVNTLLLKAGENISLDSLNNQEVTVSGHIYLNNGMAVLKVWDIISPVIESEVETETETEVETIIETEAETEPAKSAIHSYDIVLSDCSWYDAYNMSLETGGYLACIDSEEEYQHIVELLENGSYENYHFYLGGCREADDYNYYWKDKNGLLFGNSIDDMNSWYGAYWYPGEPSYIDIGSDAAASNINENVLGLFRVSGSWYLNDTSDDILNNYPGLFDGKVGFIIEYE